MESILQNGVVIGEMPTTPVAFFTFILLIRFSTKSGFTEEKEKLLN